MKRKEEFMEILRVENLSKIYGEGISKVVALNNISFSVNKGEFVAIVGASRKWKINTITFNWRSR
jgi:putative ABC transport system ATP-binding protein